MLHEILMEYRLLLAVRLLNAAYDIVPDQHPEKEIWARHVYALADECRRRSVYDRMAKRGGGQ
jgi:hypothetical protein